MSAAPFDVVVAATGVANVASVTAALQRLGARPRLSLDAAELGAAPAVVLPGVGAFAAGMGALRGAGVTEALAERARSGRPLLAVCLGMQLLGTASAESPGVAGLGVLPAAAARLEAAPRLPHFGWNRVEADGAGMLRSGDAYFAHSYAFTDVAALERGGWRVATAIEGAPFAAAVEREGVLACQFHPELSGAFGAALLGRWLEGARARAAAATAGGAAWS